MTSTNPKNQEKAGFDVSMDESSLRRKPLRTQIEREQKGTNFKMNETLYPPINDCQEPNGNDMYDDDMYSAQNGAEEHSVANQLVCDSSEINVDEELEVRYTFSRRSHSREKDPLALNSPDKIEKVRKRKTMEHYEESRKSPNRVEDPPEINPFDLNPSRKKLFDKLPKRNPCTVKLSTVPKNKLKHTPERANISKSINVGEELEVRYTFSRRSRSREYNPKNIIFLVIAIIVSVLVIKVFFNSYLPEEKVTFNYESIVSSFQNSFKGQPVYSFKVFRAALRAINATEPSAPAVILFLASKGAESLARSLGEKLVNSVSPSPIKISGKDYEKLDRDSGKKIIDDALRSMNADSDSEYGAVLVEDLHRIPGETALMFHTYCDNENAPYKHAVYVLIVHMDETIPVDSRLKDWDIAVYKRLNRAWRDIDEDQRGPLLSRLTVSVAAIVENDKTV